MYYKEKDKSKFDKFLAGKGFYAVLAICVLTVALATYFTVAKLSVPEKPKNTNSVNSESFNINSENIITSKPAQNITSSEPYTSQNETSENEVIEQNAASYFVLPVTGEILKDYSATALQFSSTFNDMRLHLGIDIAAKRGTAVKSAGDGKVLSVSETSDLGVIVTVEHSNKITAKYCGLDKVTVKEGDSVLMGQAIGEIGTIPSECVDEPHLHFEIFRDNKSVSPMTLIDEFSN